MCTFTHSGARDAYPTNCATWKGARAFCRAQGGDLPTEAQWEYAASMSGRTFKTSFAWGQGSESAPACTDVVYGRSTSIGFAAVCSTAGLGPAPVTVGDHPGGDVTPTLGLVGFGGSLSEWTVDTFAPMASACWVGAPLLSPSCNDPAVAAHAARGGAWASGSDQLVVDTRYDEDGTY